MCCHLRKVFQVFLCSYINCQATLVFRPGSFVAGLNSQILRSVEFTIISEKFFKFSEIFISKFTNIWQIKHASSVVCIFSCYIPSKIDILQLPVSNDTDLWTSNKWAVRNCWSHFSRCTSCPLAGHGRIVCTSKWLQSKAADASWTSYGALEEFYLIFLGAFLCDIRTTLSYLLLLFLVGYLMMPSESRLYSVGTLLLK